jgi:pimeloyl-ACP methyl ester carboxylesterase
VVQIGAAQPNAATQYPAHLMDADPTLAALPGKLAQLRTAGPPANPKEACEKFWAVLREVMVTNPEDAGKINWSPCDYPNELLFMKHWTENIFPSIQALRLEPGEFSKVKAPVLTIHGTRDRQSPYGAGREWASILPNARLLTVEGAAHVPWIEAPEKVFGSIGTFLDGAWPESAEAVLDAKPWVSARLRRALTSPYPYSQTAEATLGHPAI